MRAPRILAFENVKANPIIETIETVLAGPPDCMQIWKVVSMKVRDNFFERGRAFDLFNLKGTTGAIRLVVTFSKKYCIIWSYGIKVACLKSPHQRR